MDITQECRKIEKELIEWRRALHQIPELDFNLTQTLAYVSEKLNSFGIETTRLDECSGIVGLIKGKNPGKTIAIRADMDGLPVREETGLSFASVNGNMHACGHDAHTAMLLAAAKILQGHTDTINGNIKLLFQAAEENSGGAKPMIDAGVMENPHVDAVFGQHIGRLFDGFKNGQVGIFYGNMMASQDHFVVKVKGKGCHGAYPRTGVDPVVITAHIITALQTLVSREINGTDSAVLTIGRINGGKVYNVIPDEVEFEGSIRALDSNIRLQFEERFKAIVEGLAKAMNGHCEINYVHGYPPVNNDKAFTTLLSQIAGKVIGPENVIEIETPSMASEDIAYFLKKAPGTFFFLASTPKGQVYPHHNAKFEIDESVLWQGTAIMVLTALEWLKKHK
jgi:amidohydrolase